ncbi:hypothetical protein MTR_8g073810 [Medicago truncatula]|uniref:Uncharacterized protein n=1 Tax=Medicago truncatula TaxID=3880 RepID=G7L9F3_MEDTR|nr:hypothetical protein MTR_8g073810 [Medicago truncatula]
MTMTLTSSTSQIQRHEYSRDINIVLFDVRENSMKFGLEYVQDIVLSKICGDGILTSDYVSSFYAINLCFWVLF